MFIDVASSDFIYYSDKAPIGIKLNILEHFDSGLEVKFPGQSDLHMLKFSQDPDTNVSVVCINPDGSEQEFYSPLHTGCFHSEDFAIAFISAGPPIMYVYFNATYPLGVITGIDGGSTEIGQFNLALPGGRKLMSVSELSGNDIQATLANGETMQLSVVVR